MNHHATLRYDVSLIRQSALAYCRRSFGALYLVSLIAVFGSLGFIVHGGDRSWVVGALSCVAIIGALFPAFLFISQYRFSLQKLRSMGVPEAQLTASDSTLSITSGAGTASLPWSSVSEVWQYPGFWLLCFSRAGFATLPLSEIPAETRNFILQQVRASGGRVG